MRSMFRLFRNLTLLGFLAASLGTGVGFAQEPEPEGNTCGQCSCDPGVCCSKGIFGNCKCEGSCPVPPQ